MNTLTLLSGRWMPSRLRFPLLFLLPVLLLAPSLVPGKRFMPLLPITQQPLASENPDAAQRASVDVNRVATDRSFPILTDELEIQRQSLSGVLPIWNPKAGLGTPLAAGSMASPWNPLRWPYFLMHPATASGWHALLSMVLAGLGMMLFLEARGLKFTAAFLGGIAFQGSGFVLANLHYIMKVDALLWAPWCLLGVDLLFRGRKNAGAILAVAVGLSGVAGFPQVFLLVCGLTLSWILVRALEAIRVEREAHRWTRSLVAALTFFSLGVAASAVQWIPMAEAAQHSARSPQSPVETQAQSLPTAALVTTILPMAFGLPSDPHAAVVDAGTWAFLAQRDLAKGLGANRLEWNLYAGLCVLALALGALLARPRLCLFPLLCLIVSWGFVFNAPGLDFLYGLPGAGLGSPARAAGLGAIAIAWLAALGFDALLVGQRSARVGTLAGGLAGGGFGFWLWWTIEPATWAQALHRQLAEVVSPDQEHLLAQLQENAVQAGARIAEGGLQLWFVSIGTCLLAYFAGRVTVRGGGVFGCVLLVIEACAVGLTWTTPSDIGAMPIFPNSDGMSALAETTGTGRLLRLDASTNGVDEVLQLARPNLPNVYGISDLTPYQALPSLALRELWQAFDPDGVYRTGISCLSSAALLDRPLLDALNVTCVLSLRPVDHPRLQLRFEEPGFYVYARRGSLGGARVVPALVDHGELTLQALSAPDHDFVASASADTRDVHASDAREPFRPGKLTLSRPAPHRIDAGIHDSSGGTLVFHEGWMPGWKITVNGQDTPLLRLDHVFFGVQIPPGNSTIRCKYEPWSLRLGAALSLLALFLIYALTRLRHRKRGLEQHDLLPHAHSGSR
ncbi:MAG: hypothetical protein ACI9F9_002519 [Candidatus Paceibacteria bacterium]|jgi:hypothetical protein